MWVFSESYHGAFQKVPHNPPSPPELTIGSGMIQTATPRCSPSAIGQFGYARLGGSRLESRQLLRRIRCYQPPTKSTGAGRASRVTRGEGGGLARYPDDQDKQRL